jgi:hypothetical protein
MLMALLAMIGLAPAPAAHNPCLGPTSGLSSGAALACDFSEAEAAARAGILIGYSGPRTHAKFRVVSVPDADGRPVPVLLAERTVSPDEAPDDAALIGASGGWVDEAAAAHGANGSWSMDLSHATFRVKAGTLVSLLSAS